MKTIRLFFILTILTGLIYPLLVTGIGYVFFPQQAAGEPELIGQSFTDARYFWGRLSATTPNPYNPLASSGSNLGPLNPALIDAVKTRITQLQHYPVPSGPVPVDLVTASASGLDPHISPAGALYQANRIAHIRKIPLEKIQQLIKQQIEDRQFGLFGEPRINVLTLNRALDNL